jgi:hypothetical protein
MDDIEYNRQMEYDMMMDELLSMGEDIDEYQKTNTEIIENAEENEKEDKILKYAIPTDEAYMMNKAINYIPIIVPLPYSKRNPKEQNRYVFESDLYNNKEEIELLTNRKIQTIIKGIRKIANLNSLIKMKEVNGNIVYKLDYKNKLNRKYVLVEEDILKSLFSNHNHNIVKIYMILKYRCDTKHETRITRKSLASAMGLSINSEKTLTSIGKLLRDLAKENYISITEKYGKQINENGKITYSKNLYIRMCTYEEWLK